MSTWSTGEVAALLGVSVPRIQQASTRLGLGRRTSGGHRRFGDEDVEAFARDMGVLPRLTGYTRTQLQVLAGLARSPLGLRSARAVGRVSGTSPNAAAEALRELVELGLVTETTAMVAEGRATEGPIWHVDVADPRWAELGPALADAVLPSRAAPKPPERLPHRLWHHFWNAEPGRLEVGGRDAGYVATRLLLSHDPQATAWALAHLPSDALKHATTNRAADPPTRHMVDNALCVR